MSAVVAWLITAPGAVPGRSRIPAWFVVIKVAPARICMNCYFIHKSPVRQVPLLKKAGQASLHGGFLSLPALMSHGSNHA
jgi:hypothetical protein